MTDQERAAALCCVVYCKDCGSIYGTAVQIEGSEKETAKFITPWIKAGDRIGTITAAEVRNSDWCKCRSPKEKAKSQRAGTTEANTLLRRAEETLRNVEQYGQWYFGTLPEEIRAYLQRAGTPDQREADETPKAD